MPFMFTREEVALKYCFTLSGGGGGGGGKFLF